MSSSFVHLHNHSSYSALDGAAKIDEMVELAVADGQPGLGVSDHGVLHGAVELYKACKKADITSVMGCEFYHVADHTERSSLKRDTHNDDFKSRYHLTVFAENNEGWQNLMKMSSDSFLEGFYAKPRVGWELLESYSEGLIVMSGCLGGMVLQHLIHEDFNGALATAGRLQDIFGKNNFFVELQDHGIPEQKRTNPQLIEISRRLDAPLIGMNDAHYISAADAESHDILLCGQTGSTLSDPDRFKFSSDQHYLKTAAEMRYIFSEVPEACDNTLAVVERANVELDFDSFHLPRFNVPAQFGSATEFLAHLALKGLQKRYGPNVPDSHYQRLAYELGVIDTMGFSDYFLIVWDLVKFADRTGIRRGPGRGSVAGSLVAYCMDIARVDPIQFNLSFERFLNPARVTMPDVDLDYETTGREAMINYCVERYGRDRVAQIITFSLIRARVAVRDTVRAMGLDHSLGTKINNAMPPLMQGEPTPISGCLEFSERYKDGYEAAGQLRNMYGSDPQVREVLDHASKLEGLVRQDSVNAAGVVITPDPITNYVPVQRRGEGNPIVTQFDKKIVEELGLLKMDFLGLRNLDIISETVRLIGYDPGLDDTSFDDEATFKLLQEGRTLGVFQAEGKGFQELLQRLKPTSIEDIAAALALYRPGPMGSNMHNDYADRKNGRQLPEVFHDDAKDILESTYYLCIYQEQVSAIAQRFAGYTPPDADNLRRIIGRKVREDMIAERGKFVSGCVAQGYSQEFSDKLFDMVDHFSAYSFNASHSFSYSFITYQTAFLKAHFPHQYMTALCSSVADDIGRSAVFLNEAREMGIEVLTPHINYSDVNFSTDGTSIRVGLAAIRSIGEGFATRILSERSRSPYKSLIDFIQRVTPSSSQVVSLALAGAFEGMGTRLGISSVASDVLTNARKVNKKLVSGQETLFDSDPLWDVEIPNYEFPQATLLEREREVLGIYVSGHPLDSMDLAPTDWKLADLVDVRPGESVDVLVLVQGVEPRTTKNGKRMANLTLSDQTASIDAVCFPRTYAAGAPQVGDIGVVTIKCDVDAFTEKPNYIFNAVVSVAGSTSNQPEVERFKIFLPRGFSRDGKAMSKLKGVLLSHSGTEVTTLYVSKSTKQELSDDIKVNPTPALMKDLKDLFVNFKEK